MPSEKRQLLDRRESPTKPLGKYIFKGKRKKARRLNEDQNYYVDRYESRYLALVLSILLLCVLDAYFTLKIIHFGGEELNPLMIKYIERNPEWCLVLKYLVTVVSLVILLIHKNFLFFGKVKAGAVIYLIFFLYFILVFYEAAIFFGHTH